jgi:hypothetical protein
MQFHNRTLLSFRLKEKAAAWFGGWRFFLYIIRNEPNHHDLRVTTNYENGKLIMVVGRPSLAALTRAGTEARPTGGIRSYKTSRLGNGAAVRRPHFRFQ